MSAAPPLAVVVCLSVAAWAAHETYQPEKRDEQKMRDEWEKRDERAQERYDWVMRELRSERAVVMYAELSREHEVTEIALMHLAHQGPAPHTKAIAMRLLREMRSERAISSLIKEIAFTYPLGSGRHPLAKYPAAYALAQIGEPAVQVILTKRLRRPATEQELKLFAAVVQHHHRLDAEVGRFRIQRALDDAQKQLEGGDPGLRTLLVTWEQNLKRVSELFDVIDRRELFYILGQRPPDGGRGNAVPCPDATD